MSGIVTAAVVVAGGTAFASKKSSDAQKKAANLQAESIDKASGISSEAVAEARAEALSLFNPAFRDISTSLNQARGDVLSGRTSAQNVLNQSFLNASSTIQTAGQQSMNAILGRSGAAQREVDIQAFSDREAAQQPAFKPFQPPPPIQRRQQPVFQPDQSAFQSNINTNTQEPMLDNTPAPQAMPMFDESLRGGTFDGRIEPDFMSQPVQHQNLRGNLQPMVSMNIGQPDNFQFRNR